jgi:hypothetical protein
VGGSNAKVTELVCNFSRGGTAARKSPTPSHAQIALKAFKVVLTVGSEALVLWIGQSSSKAKEVQKANPGSKIEEIDWAEYERKHERGCGRYYSC